MHHTLFISDLHLESSRPDITAWFLNFLTDQAPLADALYILGDFFEVWIGDDHRSEFNQTIIAALKKQTDAGLPIYVMRGNRDFLLGEKFAQETGCCLLVDPTVITLYGKRILLMHGDSLCIRDRKHQRFRAYSQNPRYNRFFLWLPLVLRRYIARFLRKLSQKHTRTVDYASMDVVPEAVNQQMQIANVEVLIHGHTHQRNIHHWIYQDHALCRIVLGDWHQAGNALRYDANGQYEFV